jgi:hypothetical protein
MSERGFPEAPDDIASVSDTRLPDLTYLKVLVARTVDDEYIAGFTNSSTIPSFLPGGEGLEVLFEPRRRNPSAGLIEFDPGVLPVDVLAKIAEDVDEPVDDTKPPEVLDAIDETLEAAGRRRRGQGRRQNADARRAIELRAMDLAEERLEKDGWTVVDVSTKRSYDFSCTRGEETLRVEVKGTTGDGSAVLLTPGEVDNARTSADDMALMVVSEIELEIDPVSGVVGATSGKLSMLLPWEIDDHGDLYPTGFEYRLND